MILERILMIPDYIFEDFSDFGKDFDDSDRIFGEFDDSGMDFDDVGQDCWGFC